MNLPELGHAPWVDWAIFCGVLLGALPFKPWLPLRHGPLQSPWLGALVLLPFLWSTERLLPSGLALHVSSACLLALMFGWPLAMWTLLPVVALASLVGRQHLPDVGSMVSHLVWLGLVPGTLSLGIGLAIRRWLPHHLFVFILGRAFIATALAVSLTGYLAYLAGRKPDTLDLEEWLLASWLMGWGEAFSTGMLVAIFVAFKPEWLLTYSDARYLPGKPPSQPPQPPEPPPASEG